MKRTLLAILLVYSANVSANAVNLHECDTDKPVAVKQKMKQMIKKHIANKKHVRKVVPFVPCGVLDDVAILDEVPVLAPAIPKYLQNFDWISQAKPHAYPIENVTRFVTSYAGMPANYVGGWYGNGMVTNFVTYLPCVTCCDKVDNPPTLTATPLPSSLWLMFSGLILFTMKRRML